MGVRSAPGGASPARHHYTSLAYIGASWALVAPFMFNFSGFAPEALEGAIAVGSMGDSCAPPRVVWMWWHPFCGVVGEHGPSVAVLSVLLLLLVAVYVVGSLVAGVG